MEQQPPSSDALLQRLQMWLDTQGYPLELEVARSFEQRGLRVVQSEYYTDPDSGAAREIDLVAHSDSRGNDKIFRVTFAIECKSSRDKPWVGFTSSLISLHPHARVVQRATNPKAYKALRKLSRNKDVQALPLLQIPSRPAYGLTQAFTTGKDVAYEAAMLAAKAALAEVTYPIDHPQRELIAVVAFPVVIIDGSLFEYFIDHAGETHVEAVSRLKLIWRNPLVGRGHTLVDIVTKKCLSEFVDEAAQSSRVLAEHLKRVDID
jgi:hypothetical protein